MFNSCTRHSIRFKLCAARDEGEQSLHRGQCRSRVLALTVILELMLLLYEPCARKRARTVRERGVRAIPQGTTGPYSTNSEVKWLERHLSWRSCFHKAGVFLIPCQNKARALHELVETSHTHGHRVAQPMGFSCSVLAQRAITPQTQCTQVL